MRHLKKIRETDAEYGWQAQSQNLISFCHILWTGIRIYIFAFSENQFIKMSTAWQRNLRRSEGSSNLPRAIGIKNQNKNNVGVQVSKKTTKRLSSVCEAADDVFGDENIGIKRPTVAGRGNRRRLRFGIFNTRYRFIRNDGNFSLYRAVSYPLSTKPVSTCKIISFKTAWWINKVNLALKKSAKF